MAHKKHRPRLVRGIANLAPVLLCAVPIWVNAEIAVSERWSEITSSGTNLDLDRSTVSSVDTVATFSEQLEGAAYKMQANGGQNWGQWLVSQESSIATDRLVATLLQVARTMSVNGSPGLYNDGVFEATFTLPADTWVQVDGGLLEVGAGWARTQLFEDGWLARVHVTEIGGFRERLLLSAAPTTYTLRAEVHAIVNINDSSTSGVGVRLVLLDGDVDGDGVGDDMDNCVEVANLDQRDSDGDGFGNLCDPDLDNSGHVDQADRLIMEGAAGSADADADLDGNGAVGPSDFDILSSYLGGLPGP